MNIIAFSIGPILAAALGLVILPFIAWFFSAEDVGRMTMLQIVLGLCTSLLCLEMHQSYVREYHEIDNKNKLFKATIIPGLVLTTIISICIFFSPISLTSFLFGLDSIFIKISLLTAMFCSFICNLLAHVIRMQQRGFAFSVSQVSPKFTLFLGIIVVLSFNLKAEFKWLILMNTTALFLTTIILLYITRDTWLPSLKEDIDVFLIKKMLSFSLPLIPGGLAFWGLTTIDRFLIRKFSGFVELGVYAVSVGLASAVSVVSSIFSNLWHPLVYKWNKEGVEPRRVESVIDIMLVFVAFVWSLTGMFSWILPLFLPAEYKAIEFLIVACIAMPLFYMLSETTVVGIGMTRKTGYAMLAALIAFLVNILINIVLIPRYGAAGASIASLMSFFIFFIIRTESSARLWYPFRRYKMYFILCIYVFFTVVFVLNKAQLPFLNVIWFFMLISVFYLYKNRMIEAINFYRNNHRRK